jgi:hypothetical protein
MAVEPRIAARVFFRKCCISVVYSKSKKRELVLLLPRKATVFYWIIELERAMRIELTTYSLGSCRSTTELRPRSLFSITYEAPHSAFGAR